MTRITDDGEFERISYVTHEKLPSKIIVSVRKSTNIRLRSILTSHAKQGVKSGA
jgi:hypothetical protein